MGTCRRIWFLSIFIWGSLINASAQDEYKYIVFFTDKEGSEFSLDQPSEFMSAEALARRQKYNIPLKENDLPLSKDYLDDIQSDGFELLGNSHWLNAVLISAATDNQEENLLAKSHVKRVIWAALEMPGGRLAISDDEALIPYYRDELFWKVAQPANHGHASDQLRMLNGQFLHNNGLMGDDMTIAVLDAGFVKADQLEAFQAMRDENRIAATFDFVDYDDNLYESSGHGTSVLGTMAGDIENTYIGTAPNASYILLKTEDILSEQIVEEFNYVLGLEYADQMGADITTTSLGYTRYNHEEMNHFPEELDGDHLIASIGGDIAASKGMIVINSAGNEGNNSWQYTSIPADGDSVLAVGAVNPNRERSSFSGIGWPLVENIKPNVMAQGEEVAVINTAGEIVLSNGTSFSAPIVAGLTACLWQAFPERSNMEILHAIEQSSSQYLAPDKLLGYGIPDFQAAYALLYQSRYEIDHYGGINVFPNPFKNNITLTLPESPDWDMNVELVNDIGQVLFEQLIQSGSRKTVNLHFNGVSGLSMGLYFLKIKTVDDVYMFKLIKV